MFVNPHNLQCRITVIFVRNIAIADLLYVVISVVPTFVSYINNNRYGTFLIYLV